MGISRRHSNAHSPTIPKQLPNIQEMVVRMIRPLRRVLCEKIFQRTVLQIFLFKGAVPYPENRVVRDEVHRAFI